MSEQPAVYLGGPIKNHRDPERWRTAVCNSEYASEFDFVSPLDGQDFVEHEEIEDEAELVLSDIEMIREADAFFAHYPSGCGRTQGTPMETILAYMVQRKPVVISWEMNEMVSAWANAFSDYTTGDMYDALHYLQCGFTDHIEYAVFDSPGATFATEHLDGGIDERRIFETIKQ